MATSTVRNVRVDFASTKIFWVVWMGPKAYGTQKHEFRVCVVFDTFWICFVLEPGEGYRQARRGVAREAAGLLTRWHRPSKWDPRRQHGTYPPSHPQTDSKQAGRHTSGRGFFHVSAFLFNAQRRPVHCSKTEQNVPTVRFLAGRAPFQRVYDIPVCRVGRV
jgi:hypothetical protein